MKCFQNLAKEFNTLKLGFYTCSALMTIKIKPINRDKCSFILAKGSFKRATRKQHTHIASPIAFLQNQKELVLAQNLES